MFVALHRSLMAFFLLVSLLCSASAAQDDRSTYVGGADVADSLLQKNCVIERRSSRSEEMFFSMSISDFSSRLERKSKVLFIGSTGDSKDDSKIAEHVFENIQEMATPIYAPSLDYVVLEAVCRRVDNHTQLVEVRFRTYGDADSQMASGKKAILLIEDGKCSVVRHATAGIVFLNLNHIGHAP